MRCALIAIGIALFASACERPRFNAGERCSLNSDCAQNLVCGLERCRRECIDSRDCAAGLMCLLLENGALGCQLPEESRCSLSSECTAGLACRFGTCTTECVEDRDCPPGASCEHDSDQEALACVEVSTELCIYNSDCGSEEDPYICGPDRRCIVECFEDRDCDPLRYCNLDRHRCHPRSELADGGT